MKETFIASVGLALKERELEDLLAASNNDYDYTVKVVRAGGDGGALFGKIVRDSYADNCRDPELRGSLLSVGGYDLSLLHDAAKSIASGRYDTGDRDSDQRVVGMVFCDFGDDAFSLLARYMPYSACFYDVEARQLTAACGRSLGERESYSNLFYGTAEGGGVAFSNDEATLQAVLRQAGGGEVLPVAPNSCYSEGVFRSYQEAEYSATDQDGIRADYTNARGIIELVNGMLERAADGSLRQTIGRLFDEYFDSDEARCRIEEFARDGMEGQVQAELRSLVEDRLDELCADTQVDASLQQRYKQALDDFIGREAVPHYNVVNIDGMEKATTGCAYYHEKFEQVLTQVQLDEPVMLIGPAGSGKNFAVAQIAEGLGLPMYYTNNASNEFKLTGFIDAGGSYRDTEFYKAFKNGGVFFLDEIDNSDPSALIVINSALANGYMAFPHETIERHPDFRCVAAANTWGAGSNLQYVGRNVLDGATLDRFDMVFFDYDRKLERALYPSEDLLEFMWAVRDATDRCRIPHIVSTRAIAKCYKKEKYGMDTETILRTNVVRGLAQDDLNMIVGALRDVPDDNPYLAALKTIRVTR